jgi:propionyl-CoA synthetase
MVTADAGMRMRQGDALQAAGRRGDPARQRRRSVLIVDRGLDKPMPRGAAATSTTRRCARSTDAQGAVRVARVERAVYILYTSGTTGKPKGVQRDTGGYAVALAASMKHIFCGKPARPTSPLSDIGWVVGHSYIVYGR